MCKDDSKIRADNSNVATNTTKFMKLKNVISQYEYCVMKKIALSIILITIVIISSSCGLISNKNEIKESFEEKLSMYPIKNLEDFYDKEGFRDEEFNKNDKGTWILYSDMAISEKEDAPLVAKGMVLRINRNTRVSEGEYFINTFNENSNGKKKYPVKMVNNQIVPTKPINDAKIEGEIKNFKFFLQYANFKDLNSYDQGNFDYNPNVPSYSAEYQLSNNDYNVKQLRKRYDIPTNKAPKLILKGVGEFKGSSIGYKNLQFEFERNNDKSIYFSDFVDYQPSEGVN